MKRKGRRGAWFPKPSKGRGLSSATVWMRAGEELWPGNLVVVVDRGRVTMGQFPPWPRETLDPTAHPRDLQGNRLHWPPSSVTAAAIASWIRWLRTPIPWAIGQPCPSESTEAFERRVVVNGRAAR